MDDLIAKASDMIEAHKSRPDATRFTHDDVTEAARAAGFGPGPESVTLTYVSAADMREAALERAAEGGWTVVSIKDDWAPVI